MTGAGWRGAPFVAIVAAAALVGCSSKSDAKSDASASAASAAAAAPPFTCIDLPGAERAALAVDGTTFYYVEFRDIRKGTERFRDESRRRYDLYRIGADGGSPTKIAADVEPEIEAAPGGRVVFRRVLKEGSDYERFYGLFVVDKDGKEAALSDPPPAKDDKGHDLDSGVNSFAIDAAKERVFFTARPDGKELKAFSVPIGGGARTAVGTETLPVVWAVTPDGKSLLARGQLGTGTQLVDAERGTAKRVGEDGFGMRLVGGAFFFEPRVPKGAESPEGVMLKVGFLDGKPGEDLAWGMKKDVIVGSDAKRVFLRRRSEKGKPVDNLLFAGDAKEGLLVAHLGVGSILAAVPGQGDKTVVLLEHGTGEIWDESDICVLSTFGVTLPARSVKKSQLPIFTNVAPLAVGDLANARIYMRTPSFDGTPNEEYAVVKFVVDAKGPEQPSALHDRARALLGEVAKATGLAHLGAQIVFTENSMMGEVHFHPGLADKPIVLGGTDESPLAVEDPFEIEIDPSQTLHHKSGSETGSFTVEGKIKNRSSSPIKVKLKTTLRTRFLEEQVNEASTVPETIPPGGSGTFKVDAGVGEKGDSIPLVAIKDGKEIPYLNAYSQRRARGEEKD